MASLFSAKPENGVSWSDTSNSVKSSAEARTGWISSRLISGQSTMRSETCTSNWLSPSILSGCKGLRLRILPPLIACIIRYRAKVIFSGGKATAASWSGFQAPPPSPSIINGPNTGSCSTNTRNS